MSTSTPARNLASHLNESPVFTLLAQSAAVIGVEAYVVGGFVRDLLLGKQGKDVDVVCIGEGAGIALAEAFAQHHQGASHVHIYKNFGTASLRYQDYEVEFVGARKESYRADSRKPLVENGTLEDDQLRRDFTINAMSISLQAATFGQLLDPFNGQQHLKDKVIITPTDPDVTFSDDPLRMMRAIRFAAQLNFDIDSETFAAIQRNAHRLSIISGERIITEVNKVVMCPQPSYGFKLMLISGLLDQFFPEMSALQGAENMEGQSHKDNFYHTLEVLDNVAKVSDDLWLRWAAIMHDIAKPVTKRFEPGRGFTFHGHEDKGARMVPGLFRRLKLPMHEPMKMVQKLVRLHLRPIGLDKAIVTDSAIRRLMVDAGEHIDELMKLCKADVTTKNPNKSRRIIENFSRVQQKMAAVKDADQLRNFQPVLTGQHIMLAYDLAPGAEVGQIKTAIREQMLDLLIPNEIGPAFAAMQPLAEKMGLKLVRSLEEVQVIIEAELAAAAAADVK